MVKVDFFRHLPLDPTFCSDILVDMATSGTILIVLSVLRRSQRPRGDELDAAEKWDTMVITPSNVPILYSVGSSGSSLAFVSASVRK
jgi:hypothetical protein